MESWIWIDIWPSLSWIVLLNLKLSSPIQRFENTGHRRNRQKLLHGSKILCCSGRWIPTDIGFNKEVYDCRWKHLWFRNL